MKVFLTLTTLLCMSLVTASDAISFRYLVPLPVTKHVSTRNWAYRLELLPEEKGDYNLQIDQNDIRGVLLDSDLLAMPSGELFIWSSPADAVSNRVRSLEVVSTVPMRGLLWMWNEVHGQLNAVTVLAPITNSLVVPYLPQSGALSTSFTLQGRSDTVDGSHIIFDYYNTDRIPGVRTTVRQDLPEFGHLTLTPGSTLLLGSIEQGDQAAWGRISAQAGDFTIAGFQTVTDQAVFGNPELSQTSALEMVPFGRADGYLAFSDPSASDHRAAYQDRFVLTNDLPVPVAVTFELHSKVFLAAEGDAEPVATTQVQQTLVNLLPFQQIEQMLGRDLFPEETGLPVRLSYAATQSVDGADLAAPIHVLHFQEGRDQPMAGSHFFASAGNELRAWLVLDSPFASRLDISSLARYVVTPPAEEGEEPAVIQETSLIQVQLFDRERLLFSQNFTLAPEDVFSLLTTERIGALMEEKFPEETISLVRVHVSVLDGRPITGKIFSQWENDIALVNPRIFTRPPVETQPEGVVK